MARTIRVLVVDDHKMFGEALELLLAGHEGIEMLGTAGSGEEALEIVAAEQPDVVLMDVDLPGIDGIETTRRLRECCSTAQVVVITAFQKQDLIARAIEAGASGYVPKTHAADELVDVLKSAAAGEMVIPEGQLAPILARVQSGRRARSEAEHRIGQLTSREIQILQEMADGKSTQAIAESLYLSPLTVQTHVKNIMSKLDVHSKLEAVTFALRHGAIRVPSID